MLRNIAGRSVREIAIEGFVLVGGASSRMGRDKSSLVFDGVTLGEHAGTVLTTVTDRVCSVGGPVAGLEEVADVVPDGEKASIYGLHAALLACRAEWAAVLACDLPFVGSELFRRLIATALSTSECKAVAPVQPDGRPQPLAAIYRRDVCLNVVEDNIREGDLRVKSLLDRLSVCYFEPAFYADLDPTGRLFLNVNTPEDYDFLTRAGS